MRKLLTILFFLPLLARAQVKDTITSDTAIGGDIPCCLTGLSNSAVGRLIFDFVNPADSVKKYQKLAIRDRDSLNKYTKLKNNKKQVHYFKLSEFRRMQLKYWRDQQDAIDAQKRRKKS